MMRFEWLSEPTSINCLPLMFIPILLQLISPSLVMQGVNASVLQEYLHRLESRKCQVYNPGCHHPCNYSSCGNLGKAVMVSSWVSLWLHVWCRCLPPS